MVTAKVAPALSLLVLILAGPAFVRAQDVGQTPASSETSSDKSGGSSTVVKPTPTLPNSDQSSSTASTGTCPAAGCPGESQKTNKDFQDSGKASAQCRSHDTPAKVAQCAASKLEANLISQMEFEDLLFDSINTLPSTTSYYSAGYEWGERKAITFGVQDHYRFRASFPLPLRIPKWGSYPSTVVLPFQADRPVVIFATNRVDWIRGFTTFLWISD